MVVNASFSPRFGDLDGDGHTEAALDVMCSNDGGTADGQLISSSVIFSATGKSLRVVGVISTTQPFAAYVPHIPMVAATVKTGKVIGWETWYGPEDGTCCASGRAKTIWLYRNEKLVPQRTVVIRRPYNGRLWQ
jgi:hypothetical protein